MRKFRLFVFCYAYAKCIWESIGFDDLVAFKQFFVSDLSFHFSAYLANLLHIVVMAGVSIIWFL